MSWVSQANLKSIMTAIRNKFTTGDLVIANDAKNTGVELNYTAQDGLVTVSPISTDASVESALHLSNGDDSKKTELTQGTLSYVTGTGDSEAYNYMSLLGNGVTFGKKGGGNVQVGGVADPTDAQQVATKNYVDGIKIKTFTYTFTINNEITVSPLTLRSLGGFSGSGDFMPKNDFNIISAEVTAVPSITPSDNVDVFYVSTRQNFPYTGVTIYLLAFNGSTTLTKTVKKGDYVITVYYYDRG